MTNDEKETKVEAGTTLHEDHEKISTNIEYTEDRERDMDKGEYSSSEHHDILLEKREKENSLNQNNMQSPNTDVDEKELNLKSEKLKTQESESISYKMSFMQITALRLEKRQLKI